MVHLVPPPLGPIASTSRIPYSSTTPASARSLSSSRPSASPRTHSHPHRRAHLIHPLARQRLTNVAFALAGVLSVATVSLGMSGSLGSAGVRPGCPARKEAAVALQGEREGARACGWKGKGRFLDDPVVPAALSSQQAGGGALVAGLLPAARLERTPREERSAGSAAAAAVATSRVDGGRIAEPADAAAPVSVGKAAGWRGWLGASERVV